jgi:predicted dithiol-disulfide oxidoreductase (DUF899 family)
MHTNLIEHPKAVSRAEWLTARKELLVKEKQLTRQRDEIDRQRRALPWVKIEKSYTFDGPDGQKTLADLFDDRSQLIVSPFHVGPGLEGRLRRMLFPFRPRGWRPRPLGASRCLIRHDFACRSPKRK